MSERVGSFFYDLSQVDAVQYLRFVAECFSYVFDLAEAFYTRIGFIWIIIAVVFFSVLTRVIFAPILGGRLNLGQDRAWKGRVSD